MSELTLAELAEKAGLPLPLALSQLFADGRTCYGKTREEWRLTWRDRMLNDPPALISTYDFEWLGESDIFETMEEWLAPEWQGGRRFLPFARTGAGDVFCLTALQEASPSVACIWHDSSESETCATSFSDFIYLRLIDALGDYSHLTEAGLDEEEGRRCLIADIRGLAPYLPTAQAEMLLTFCDHPARHVEKAEGRRSVSVPCLISGNEALKARSLIADCAASPFQITPRWEIG